MVPWLCRVLCPHLSIITSGVQLEHWLVGEFDKQKVSPESWNQGTEIRLVTCIMWVTPLVTLGQEIALCQATVFILAQLYICLWVGPGDDAHFLPQHQTCLAVTALGHRGYFIVWQRRRFCLFPLPSVVSDYFSGREAERKARVWKISGLREHQPRVWWGGDEMSGVSGIWKMLNIWQKNNNKSLERDLKKNSSTVNPDLHQGKLRM